MANKKKDEIISEASPHTIKKFELIEAYADEWARKLLGYGNKSGKCNGIVFIDCMSNSGMYKRKGTEELVEGTPIRVAKRLASIMREQFYQDKQAWLYFNDFSAEKIEELEKHLPANTHNFHIQTSVGDGNVLLKEIGKRLNQQLKINYLLVYDPYQAAIDWSALLPFIRNWGEVIINHMVYDSIRAVSQATRAETISKYEQTYLAKIEDLIEFGSDRDAFEKRIHDIIIAIKNAGTGKKRYYIASYPFFNTQNTVVYNLLHCTSNKVGFGLYKSTAWKTFNGQSSLKRTEFSQGQLTIDTLLSGEDGLVLTTATDENCYYVDDIVKFILTTFKGRSNVPLTEIWAVVDEHPIFPSDLFKNDIKDKLRAQGYKVHRSSIDFV